MNKDSKISSYLNSPVSKSSPSREVTVPPTPSQLNALTSQDEFTQIPARSQPTLEDNKIPYHAIP